MQQTTRAQGYAICGGASRGALLCVVGIFTRNGWALAIPGAGLTLCARGLVAWVGFTIATIQVEADQTAEPAVAERAAKGAAEDPA